MSSCNKDTKYDDKQPRANCEEIASEDALPAMLPLCSKSKDSELAPKALVMEIKSTTNITRVTKLLSQLGEMVFSIFYKTPRIGHSE